MLAGVGSLNNKTSFSEGERERETPTRLRTLKREDGTRLPRRPGRGNLVCAISTGIFVAEPAHGLFSGVFKFKTSLVAYPGTRTLFGGLDAKGITRYPLFHQRVTRPLTVSGPVLYNMAGMSVLLHLFSLFFLPCFFFSPGVSLSRSERTESTRKGRAPVRRIAQAFYHIFTDHAAKHSFRFAIILQLSRIDLSAAATLR